MLSGTGEQTVGFAADYRSPTEFSVAWMYSKRWVLRQWAAVRCAGGGAAMTGQPPLPLAAFPTLTTATAKSPPPSSGALLKAVGKVGEHLPAPQPCQQPPNQAWHPALRKPQQQCRGAARCARVLWPGHARGPCSAFCHDRSPGKQQAAEQPPMNACCGPGCPAPAPAAPAPRRRRWRQNPSARFRLPCCSHRSITAARLRPWTPAAVSAPSSWPSRPQRCWRHRAAVSRGRCATREGR